MTSQQYLSALSENASRLGMRLQESISEHTRDLNIARGSGAAYLDTSDEKTKNIKKQLESSSEREKLDAMKRLVALISKGRNATEYFASVVKNVASPNLEIRKLVYIYLLKYAEHEPDLALLSINTFQKDLGDSSPLIRGMALRVLSGIRVGMVGSLVVLAIKKCAKDTSPYVRKGAALAVPKCYDLDNTHLPALIEIITTLLQDRSPLSLGAVTVAFEAVCPTRLDLIHQHFRRFCKLLVEVDEWGQVEVMNLLLRYARTMLVRPVWKDGVGGGVDEDEHELDKDLKLLLDSVKPIFQSRNPAVILAATRVLFYGAPPSYWSLFVNPLLRLLATSREVERVVLADLLIMTRTEPHLFSSHYTRFLVRSDDFTQVKKDKIRLLLNVLNIDNYAAIMREFIDYAEDINDTVVTEAIMALGQCATRIPECMPQCLTALITMIKSRYDIVVSSAVMVLKRLVQLQLSTQVTVAYASTSQSPLSIISHLARRIDDIKHAQARACVVWLVGQYGASEEKGLGPEGLADWAPDVLRKLAKSFAGEASLVKLQVITLASKLFVLSPNDKTLGLLAKYVFSQARYDVNYDVRDRARMLSSLLVGVGLEANGVDREERAGVVLRREQVRLVLFEGKAVAGEEHSVGDHKALVGSLSRVTGKSMQGDEILPDWLERGVESSLRDSEYDAPPPPPVATALSSSKARAIGPSVSSPIVLTPTGGTSPIPGSRGKGPWTDLDSFYADEEEEDEESDEEEEDGESDGEARTEEDESEGEISGQSDSEKGSKHDA
ncbi:adaptin N terminal region-domain-containing protein [Crepidotus variabilis]|uniref:Adaptin N terminal region-domain-containing protein n=1 Tax=Crepidotus variabilis TaxID=179855 RepID=A0A9P6E3Y9_9AGAR|nr:adaptin N terminal region-domain-containing protein [Crepidotus variabilis]